MIPLMNPENRTWILVNDVFSLETMHHSETIFTIGNGYLGTRATFAEGHHNEIASTLVHGIYNHHPSDAVPDLANFPAWFAMQFTIDGQPFRLDEGKILGYRQWLDLRRPVLQRQVLWQAPRHGQVLRFAFERFASMDDPHILAQRVSVLALDRVDQLACAAYLDYDRAVNPVFDLVEGLQMVHHWTDVQTGAPTREDAWWTASTAQSGYQVALAQHVTLSRTVDAWTPTQMDDSPGTQFVLSLAPGESITLTRVVGIATSRDTDDPLALATAKRDEAAAADYDALEAAHAQAWSAIWNDMDVVIEGDEFAQKAIRFSLYHLLIAAPRHDERASIGAKSLSGPGYKGHVFWDTEIFMLPPLIVSQPELARNLLMYRYHNLAGARRKAAAEGYEGAMFPWESTDTGEETTPQWTQPDSTGHRIRIWTGDNEQHVSSDIAHAVWQYWRWTGDDAFLRDYGAEIILDTAVFWGSRAEWQASQGRYALSRQIGPDEFHENVDNSVYTNWVVAWHLRRALDVLAWLRQHAPEKGVALVAQLRLTEERLDHWRDIIAKLVVPRYTPLDVYEQFEGFFDLDAIDVEAYEPRVTNMDLILGHGRTQQTQVLKQADIVMLIALFGHQIGARDDLLRNWRTYVPRTAHDSSLSPAMHAWVGARLGLVDQAYRFWLRSAGLDLENNKGNVSAGIHAAATGALWQATVFGFAGLHLDANGQWALDPHLPPWWKSLAFTFYHHGQRHAVRLTP